MKKTAATSEFSTKLLCPAKSDKSCTWAFLILPKAVSDNLPRRGRTSIEGTINGHPVKATLEPDGQLSHWLKVSAELQKLCSLQIGDTVTLEIAPVDEEPEPIVPDDLYEALKESPQAKVVWDDTTTIARIDWIHWIESAKQAKTRVSRISNACDMLASGKRRVCCFDQSGFYSKSLSAPTAAE